MKKLALVLGSLLVVGSVASAKEVMPAPTPAPEVVVKVVEKPVVVYRDRVVEDTKWRPNGYVSANFKTMGEIESTDSEDVRSWEGAEPKSRLELKTKVNFTENQALEIRTRDWRGLNHKSNKTGIERDEAYVQHTYDFGKLGDSKVNMALVSKYTYKDHDETETGSLQTIKEKVEFNFADYFFANDYFKTTNAVLAPVFAYNWDRKGHENHYALYADYQAELAYGINFEAEFDNLFDYAKDNGKNKAGEDNKATKTGSVELTLDKTFDLYKAGKHTVDTNLKGVYTTNWMYSKTKKDGSKAEKRWNEYTAKFEPTLNYTYAATEYVKLHATLGAEYKNRVKTKSEAKRWRWQPYSEIGFKATF